MAGPLIVFLLVLYMGALFFVAWSVDKGGRGGGRGSGRARIYTLSLSVLCTSWTYFGAVGSATRDGWLFLPNFLGPVLAIGLFFWLYQRIAVASKRENVGSIADFLSSRYGKSRVLGTLVACVSLAGAIPYIALQLTSLARAWAFVAHRPEPPPFAPAVIVAALAGFAILFGARRPTLTTHNRGLVRVIAIESVVKLSALAVVAVLGVLLLLQARGTGAAFELGPLARPPSDSLSFLTGALLCMVTAITLPRQFHLSFVELEDPADLKTARILFPAYMCLWAGAVFAIAVVCRGLGVEGVDPDMLVLQLPMAHGGALLTALVFLGGFSAGAAMVMVETVALSAMICNELVLPWLATTRWRAHPDLDVARTIVVIRRGAIVSILMMAWLYYLLLSHEVGLAQLGFTSLAASAQLLPALVGAVTWRRGHLRGAVAGIAGGSAVWLYAVVGPQIRTHWGLPAWWRPEEVLHASGSDLMNHGVLLGLALNVLLYVGVSLVTRPRLIDRVQSAAFVLAPAQGMGGGARELRGTIGDLRALAAQFLGPDDAARGFDDFARRSRRRLRDGDPVDAAAARAAERMLAGAIGASTARNVIDVALSRKSDRADAGQLLDEAAQAVQFSRELLQTTLNSLDQAVCVTDSQHRLVAWNSRYLELFRLSVNDVAVGTPLAELIRTSGASLGDSAEDIERFVDLRVNAIRHRRPLEFEREWPDGTTLKIVGAPTPSGEYVTSFTDITELRAAARALRVSNERLEERVEDRTRELTQANRQLAEAKARADKATAAQARFVAAASHDLLQPLHAARLFNAAVAEDLPAGEGGPREMMQKADLSIDAADRLLRALLNLSRLEMDGVTPTFSPVELGSLLSALGREFSPIAAAKGLELRIVPTRLWVMSDPDLLRSVLQNLIGNAIRYTATGAILIGCRRAQGQARIEVRDSGIGVDPASLPEIFREFTRLPEAVATAPGAGLGLSIADRICAVLGHALEARSAPGRGSTFSVRAERCRPVARAPSPLGHGKLARPLRVLCVENDPLILEGLERLITRWGGQCAGAGSYTAALALKGPWDVALVDYHLEDDGDGLQVLQSLRASAAMLALITANDEEAVIQRAGALGAEVLRKPVAPASLRAFLSRAAMIEPASGGPPPKRRALRKQHRLRAVRHA